MTDKPTITALAPWFGGNRLLAEEVGKELAGCRWVGVPFAGGMPELQHIDAPTIVVSDIHQAVINLARVCADPKLGPALYRRLRRLPFHPDVLADAQQCCRTWDSVPAKLPCLEWATDYFVAVWMARGGNAGTDREFSGNLPTRWNANGGDSNTRYRSAVSSLGAWRRILQRCNFVVMDCFDFLAKVCDEPGVGVYCDPPFPGAGEKYKHKFTEEQHRKLAHWLAHFEYARVVCRFYDHPLIHELYPDDVWTWRHLVGRKQSNADGPEVLLINGPSQIGSPALF